MKTIWLPIAIVEACGLNNGWTHAIVEDEDLDAILAAVSGSSAIVPDDCKNAAGDPMHTFMGREDLDQ